MRFMECGIRPQAAIAAGVLAGSLALLPVGARAQGQQTYVMKITTPTIHDIPDTWAKNFAAAVEKDSGGRIKGQVFPASQLGSIPRQIEGTQFGSIQCLVLPPEFMVGLDERFQVLAAPGLVDDQLHGQRVAADPAVLKLMLGLGDDKGLHGIGLFEATPSSVVTRMPLRHLADFKGKKIRIFASQFQSVAFDRLGVTPVAMSLGDVLPAIQQGAIDGAVTGMGPIANMHFVDAAKFVTMTNQPSIFIIADLNKKWFESLPKDLQDIITRDAAAQDLAINAIAVQMFQQTQDSYKASGGELIDLPPAEQASMMKTLATVGTDVSSKSPELAAAYRIVTDAAAKTRQAPSQ
jgi:TRAP-type C4-dicarboxylate transport system substrate-binding protein